MGSISNAQSATGVDLPVINISSTTLEVGTALLDAATRYGFLYIDSEGTGFTKEIVDREFALSQQFFALSDDEKGVYLISGLNRGWTGMHTETLDPKTQRKGDFKEAFNIGEFDPEGKPQQPMPPVLAERESELYEFENLCMRTCNRILDLLALGLEIEDLEFFSSRHTKPSGCTMRFLHYPAMPDDVEDYEPEVDIRAGAHSDYGSMTLLFQRAGQPGLEIRNPTNEWASVPVFPERYTSSFPPILVNIADLLSYWTNGLLKSTVHRVIFPRDARRGGEDRYSIAYFSHPAFTTKLIPVPSRIVRERAGKGAEEVVGYGGGAVRKGAFEAITAQEHLSNRLEATYGIKMHPTNKE